MFQRTPAWARILALLLLLSATVFAQTTSLATEHSHQHSSDHCCGLCHMGPLPFIQPAVASAATPVLCVAWIAIASESDSPREVLMIAGASRAPPA